MKVSLLFKDATMDWKRVNKENRCFDDFKCRVILDIMSDDDTLIYECTKKVMMYNLTSKEQIRYRQNVLKDCIRNREIILKVYEILGSAMNDITTNRKYILLNDYPSVVLSNSIQKLQHYVEKYVRIGEMLVESEDRFHSEGFKTFINEYKKDITPDFLQRIQDTIRFLENSENISVNTSMGVAGQGINYKLNRAFKSHTSNIRAGHSAYKISTKNWDARKMECLYDLKQLGIEATADILACVVEEMTAFFTELQKEIAFYCGCIHLYNKLAKIGCKLCFPEIYDAEENKFSFSGLIDVGLALSQDKQVVGNTLNMNNCELVIITGANQGGKSTFLRSIGLAQIMFQCGMFVGAEKYEASICNGICTHFRKSEDTTLNRGKFDDELQRFSESIDELMPYSILMCNESFSSTNEREGTEVAIPIIDAMLDSNIKMFFVTHFYSIPFHYMHSGRDGVMILQAERKEDTTRSFKMVETQLTENSYGMDLYQRLF